jgi:CBS domain-containing protein
MGIKLQARTLLTTNNSGDKPLTDALLLMSDEGLTSVAVVDNAMNVIGNISSADVKHLTNTSSLPLLKSSCLQFISVILSEKGVENGKDSFPVFYVNPYSTLAHTTAKLVATKAHRMWIVEGSSPSPSAPATPAISSTILVPSHGSSPASPGLNASFPVISSTTGVSGRLTGVITLTDILNLFARQSGLHPSDPNDQRQRRRRSSSSSIRASMDFGRGSRSSFDSRWQ